MVFRKNLNIQMGLDINLDGIRAVILQKQDKNIFLKNHDFELFDEITIKNGIICNEESFIKSLKAIITRQNINIKDVNIALPTNIAFMKTISLPNLPMEELQIIVPQEAAKHIPFPIEKANIDFQILNTNDKKVEVILAALTQEIVKSYTTTIEKTGLSLKAIDLSPFAMIRTLANADFIEESDTLNISVLIGYENTDINIINRGMTVFSHTVGVGKKNIVDSLAVTLEINNAEVNKLLPEVALIIPGMESSPDPLLNKASSVTKTVINSICAEIQKAIEFYNSQNEEKEIKSVILGGEGVCLKNIDKYISSRLKIETFLCDSLKNIKHDLQDFNSQNLAVGVGLALKGFENENKSSTPNYLNMININLANKQNKPAKQVRFQLKKEDIEPKIKVMSIIIVVSSCIIFALSASTWLIAHHYTKKFNRELSQIKLKHEQLNLELNKTTFDHKELEYNKKILELKLLTYNQIKNNWMSWYKILNDIPKIVPKDIKITEISRIYSVNIQSFANSSSIPDGTTAISIKGKIPEITKTKNDPLELISYFALNINENPSLKLSLSDATIKTVEHKDKDHLYEFSMETFLSRSPIESKIPVLDLMNNNSNSASKKSENQLGNSTKDLTSNNREGK